MIPLAIYRILKLTLYLKPAWAAKLETSEERDPPDFRQAISCEKQAPKILIAWLARADEFMQSA